MSKNTVKQIREGIIKAQNLAQCELRLKRLRELDAPAQVIQNEEELLAKHQAKVKGDLIAATLLPQARVSVATYKRREEVLDNALLGRILTALEELRMYISGLRIEEPACPFEDEAQQANWSILVTGLKKLDVKIADSLWELLTAVSTDLLFTRIPDVPSPYMYEERTYSPKEVN